MQPMPLTDRHLSRTVEPDIKLCQAAPAIEINANNKGFISPRLLQQQPRLLTTQEIRLTSAATFTSSLHHYCHYCQLNL